LSDICDMLSHRNIRTLFGNWKLHLEVDQQAQKVFSFRGRNIILKAIGAGTRVRGINRKNARPDVIIMDDIQTKEQAESKEISDALLRWMLGTLGKAVSNGACTYIFIGNMYPQNSILAMLKKNPQWTSFVVGGILADGSSLWEQLKPLEGLVEEYDSDLSMGHPEIFLSEILNNTDVSGASGIDFSKIPNMPDWMLEDGVEPDGGFILIDPSNARKGSDDTTLNVFLVYDGVPVMREVVHKLLTPKQTIVDALTLAFKWNIRLICVEDTAYQASLLFWFSEHCEQRGITGFEFHPVSPKNRAKNNRIKAGLVRCLKGQTWLHPEVRSLVISQGMEWHPLKQNNTDDIIDPLGYVEEVLKNYEGVLATFNHNVIEVTAKVSSDILEPALPF